MSKFTHYKATLRLKELAKNPIDLTVEGNLTPSRLESMYGEACGYRLLYGTERVTVEVIEALEALAKEAEALAKMERMQAGEITNFIEGHPSENRPVLHTAVRDFFDNSRGGEAVELAKREVDKLKAFDMSPFTDLVMIAIGGSDLGPRANTLALENLQIPGKKTHFISNVDPDDAAMVLRGIDLSQTLVVVVSKSGTTLETTTNEELVRARFEKEGLDPKKHFVAVTGKGSPMDAKERYLECFYIWDWVGGRFSSSSMVGGVVMTFAYGFDAYWEFLKGAHAMDKAALHSELHRNLPLLSALLGIWNHNFLGAPTLAVVPYSQGLHRYAAHIQQVDMESNGKWIDQQGEPADFQTGPILWGEPGTNAQHSFFQLIHQGTATVPMLLIGFKEGQCGEDFSYQGTSSHQKLLSNLFAQAIALATGKKNTNPNQFFPGNRPSHMLLGKKLTPFALGALFSFFEHRVAFQGFIWGINSFDQEGVQLGKVLATKIIDRFADPKGEPYPLGDAYLNHLEKI